MRKVDIFFENEQNIIASIGGFWFLLIIIPLFILYPCIQCCHYIEHRVNHILRDKKVASYHSSFSVEEFVKLRYEVEKVAEDNKKLRKEV